MIGPPRICSGRKRPVERGTDHAEFIGVQLAEYDSARSLRSPHNLGIFLRDFGFEDAGPVGSAQTGGVDQNP